MVIVREWATEVTGESGLRNALTLATFGIIEVGFLGGVLVNALPYHDAGLLAIFASLAIMFPLSVTLVMASKLRSPRQLAVSMKLPSEPHFFSSFSMPAAGAASNLRRIKQSLRGGFLFLADDGLGVCTDSGAVIEVIPYERISEVHCVEFRGWFLRAPQLRLKFRAGEQATFALAYPGLRGTRLYSREELLQLCTQLDRHIESAKGR